MASDASATDTTLGRHLANPFAPSPWKPPLQPPWAPQIHFQLSAPKNSSQPPNRFTIPLRLAMDASPVIDRDFDGAHRDLDQKNVVATLNNGINPDCISLFLQYISRHKRALAAKFPLLSDEQKLPKLWLWTQTYQLAAQFEVAGLQRLLARRIRRKLLELEDEGVMCDEWWGVVKLVMDETVEWEWLREIMVDVKRVVAVEKREKGICIADELPEDKEGWEVLSLVCG